MRGRIFLAFGALVWASATGASLAAEEISPADRAEAQRLIGIAKAQHRMIGDVAIPAAAATLHLGPRYYFLGPDEAKQVLKEWGNPPSAAEGVLGIVFPADKSFVDDTWGAVITFEPAGYVTDKDADKADYNKLLDDVRKHEAENNEARKKEGYQATHLVGWAQPPSYDPRHHYLIWARDIQFAGNPTDGLNYDVRLLGRRGYLSLNLISAMPKLASVRADAAQLASAANFDAGNQYGDFNSQTDKKAEYGVAGLVAAGLGLAAAQKFGLLALVVIFAKKLWIIAIALAAGGWTWIRNRFRPKPEAPKGEEAKMLPHEGETSRSD